ncbi:MAG: GNAT family N-acetyltransferase [Lachnospiraceae bacterium]|nr:GNAT family N-acetyltransferase [Lachnospiraceae bacterium]
MKNWGIATQALSHAIREAFQNGAETLWVDPHPENGKAIALYQRLGFVRKKMRCPLKSR